MPPGLHRPARKPASYLTAPPAGTRSTSTSPELPLSRGQESHATCRSGTRTGRHDETEEATSRLQPTPEGFEVARRLPATEPPLPLLADGRREAELEDGVEGLVRIGQH